MNQELLYLNLLTKTVELTALVLVFPYVIIGLSLTITDLKKIPEEKADKKIRFMDEKNNIKLVTPVSNVLYISAEENYIHIYYIEKDKLKTFILRNTMQKIEELCKNNGLIRCHRSYYVNKDHIKTLRKEKDNIIIAELDSSEKFHIPVSKRYYDTLTEII